MADWFISQMFDVQILPNDICWINLFDLSAMHPLNTKNAISHYIENAKENVRKEKNAT